MTSWAAADGAQSTERPPSAVMAEDSAFTCTVTLGDSSAVYVRVLLVDDRGTATWSSFP